MFIGSIGGLRSASATNSSWNATASRAINDQVATVAARDVGNPGPGI
jgi:hypothetical protein